MEDSKKQMWAMRLLTLLVLSVALSVFFKFGPNTLTKYENRIEIRANDHVGEIITAIEAMQREDIHIVTSGKELTMNEYQLIPLIIGFFLFIGIVLGVYHTLYCLLNALFNMTRRDDSTLQPYNDLPLS